MCDICIKHGDGRKWYLESTFYASELEKAGMREFLLKKAYERFEWFFARSSPYLGMFKAIPGLARLVDFPVEAVMKREHYGQVVPIEDVRLILNLATSIYRQPCVCKSVLRGKQDHNLCLGFGMFPKNYFKEYADYSEYTIRIDVDEALELMTESEKDGYIHTVWTYRTPYIGKLCNCDVPDCVAFSTRRNFGTRTVYKSEYVFQIDPAVCTGCRSCISQCQFGAIAYSPITNRCVINSDLCYGCGVCRVACKNDSISERARTPVLGW